MSTQPTPRRCDKPSCGDTAAASLSFRYDTGEVWIHDLAEDPHPSRYDLCQPHAEHLIVPRGWQRVDERTAAVRSLAAPAAADRATEQVAVGGSWPAPPASHPASEGNRYAQLSAELPRLAAEVGSDEDEGEGGAEGDDTPGAAAAAAGGQSRQLGPPATSRGLTPADVPGAGGVVLDFFDRPRERAGAGEADTPAAGESAAAPAGAPRPPVADEPDEPDPGPVAPT